MIRFIFGQDEYRIKERITEIIGDFKKESRPVFIQNFNFNLEDGFNKEELSGLIRSEGIFGDKKAIILSNVFKRKEPEIAHFLKDQGLTMGDEVLLIFTSFLGKKECQNKDKELWSLLYKKENNPEEILPLDDKQLSYWIIEKFRDTGISISLPIARKIILYSGNDSRLISMELEKLICFKKSGNISEEDVESLLVRNQDTGSFAIVDAVSYGQKAKAVELFHKYISSGSDPQALFGAMVYQFRNMISSKSMAEKGMSRSEILKDLKLHPFVASKSYDAALRFNMPELRNIYGQLAKIEERAKGGTFDIDRQIFYFIVNF